MMRKFTIMIAVLLVAAINVMGQYAKYPLQSTVDDFVGTNSFAYLGTAVYKDGANLSVHGKALGWIREYHPYAQTMEGVNPAYNNSGAWNGDFDGYYQEMKQLGITMKPVMWYDDQLKATIDDSPYSYSFYAEHLFQFAARYGTQTVADNRLLVGTGTVKRSGLDYVNYVEVWNEPDRTWCDDCLDPDLGWNVSMFEPADHAALMSAAWDGHQGAMGTNVGVKQADPNFQLMLGGLFNLNSSYLRDMNGWFVANRTDGVIPVDVISVHHYCNSFDILATVADGAKGVSPESNGIEARLESIVRFRDNNWPNVRISFNEFGYDVNPASPQRAVAVGSMSAEITQAVWNLRIYLLSLGVGIDECGMFMINDGDDPTMKYLSSGMMAGVYGGTPRAQAYYMATLRDQLAGMKYVENKNVAQDSVYIYKFMNTAGTNGAYVIWSGTTSDVQTPSYTLDVESANTAQVVEFMHWDENGTDPVALAISGSNVTLAISETPKIILVDNIGRTTIDPPSPPNYVDNGPYCAGDIQLSVTGVVAGGIVKWYSDYSGTQLVGTGNPVTITGVGTGPQSYYVRQVDTGVESTIPNQVDITVESLPLAVFSANAAVLTANPGVDSYQWNLNGTPVNGATAITYTAVASGSYTVTTYKGNCEQTSAAVTVTVSGGPTAPTAYISGVSSVCQGSTGSLTVNLSGVAPFSITYLVNGGNAQTVPAINNTTYTLSGLTTSGSYTLSAVSDANMAGSVSGTGTVTINALPTPTITQTGSNNEQLSTTASGTYQWYKDSSPIGGATQQAYTATVSGSYTVMVTSNSCSGTSPAVTVTIQLGLDDSNPPTVSPTSYTYCQNDVIQAITVNGTAIKWYSDANLSTLVYSDNTYTPTAAGTLYVTQTETSKNESTGVSIAIVINSLPAAYILEPTTGMLQANTGDSYQWAGPSGTINGATQQTYSPTVDGNYTVTITVSGCSTTSSAYPYTDDTVIQPDPPVVQATYNMLVGSITALSATGQNLLWYDNNGLSSPVGSGTSWTPPITTASIYVYYITQTVGGATSAASTITVTATDPIANQPNAPTTASTSITMEEEAITTITVYGDAGATFAWYDAPNASNPFAPGATFTPASSRTVYVTQTVNGVESPQLVITITITPFAVSITQVGTVLTTTPTVSGGTYTWYEQSNPSAILSSMMAFTPTESGTYVVLVRKNGISATDSYAVVITPTGVTEALAKAVVVYPIPAKDVVNVDAPAGASITILTKEGQLVSVVENGETSVANLASGLYLVRVETAGAVIIKKLIIE